MIGDSPAAAELDVLLDHPSLRGRWPGGFTADDLLEALMALGRITLHVRDDVRAPADAPSRFACRLELREEGVGAVVGAGHTLTAAGLRCLIQAEAELSAEVERGLDALRELLGGR